MKALPHITACVCTYRRAGLLKQLLTELAKQTTHGLFSYSAVVADNDQFQSAKIIVSECRAVLPLEIRYCVEPEQNIALARNKALTNADGDFVAFIDDDEVPAPEWLLQLFQAIQKYQCDGVLGPVKPRFVEPPPPWALRAGFFERPNSQDYETGLALRPTQTGTGNVLIQSSVLRDVKGPFRQEFGSGGEDIDFFRRAMEAGKVFVWCAEAVAYEIVPAERMRISFQLRRALLRGKGSLASPAGRPLGILKSLAACAIYTMVLPISLMAGRHVFLKYLVRQCDHLGKLLSFIGIDLVKQKYVLE